MVITTLGLSACGDLTRSDAEAILNGEGRGNACQVTLSFVEGAFERARTSGVVTMIREESGLLGTVYKVADLPNGDRWQVVVLGFEKSQIVSRKRDKNSCLPGRVEIQTLADPPFAPNNTSYKAVEFVEVVTLPPELKALAPFVYSRYQKSAIFQKTDKGWRIAR